MARFRKILRILSLVFLIVLAAVGIGITGAAPILSKKWGQFFEEIKIELVESEEENTDTMELKDIE